MARLYESLCEIMENINIAYSFMVCVNNSHDEFYNINKW